MDYQSYQQPYQQPYQPYQQPSYQQPSYQQPLPSYQQMPPMRQPMQSLPPRNMNTYNGNRLNNYPNWHPANWAPHYQAGAGIGIVVFIIVVIVLIIYFTSPTTYMSFKPKTPKSTHVSYNPNRIQPRLNFTKKRNFNNDDRTADEYYDDRTFARSNKTAHSNHKAKFGLKLPGTNTSYRKFTEKSSY